MLQQQGDAGVHFQIAQPGALGQRGEQIDNNQQKRQSGIDVVVGVLQAELAFVQNVAQVFEEGVDLAALFVAFAITAVFETNSLVLLAALALALDIRSPADRP